MKLLSLYEITLPAGTRENPTPHTRENQYLAMDGMNVRKGADYRNRHPPVNTC